MKIENPKSRGLQQPRSGRGVSHAAFPMIFTPRQSARFAFARARARAETGYIVPAI